MERPEIDDDPLEKSIEELYSVFAHYRRPAAISACPCGCTDLDRISPLLSIPLRQLRFADLAYYSFKAMTTVGSLDDFRYFLPRLFQGVTEESYSYNPEILFRKLDHAKWKTWPADEISAIRTLLDAIWQRGLASFPLNERLPAFFEIETLLASIAGTGEALEPYLRTWTDTKIQTADEHLIQFVTMFGRELFEGHSFEQGFWEPLMPQADAIRKWLLQPDTLRRITDKAHLLRNDGFEHLFAPAFETLQLQDRD